MKKRKEKLPVALKDNLKNYLDEDEEIIFFAKEVPVLSIDFRWIILTQFRIILVVRTLVEYSFRDFVCKELDMDLNLGFIFDIVELEVPGKQYRATFFSWNRNKTLKFFSNLKHCKVYHHVEHSIKGIKEEKPIFLLQELLKVKNAGGLSEKEFEKKKMEILKRI